MRRPSRASGRTAGRLATLSSLALGAACGRGEAHELTIVDGLSTTRVAARSAYAEYVELPSDRNELRLTFATHPVSCEHWIPPGEKDVVVTVAILLPSDKKPAVGTYGWTGVPPVGTPLAAPYALPKAQLGSRSRLFEPGGGVSLSAVQLDLHGAVNGTLAFEFPGEGERPATRIDGGFEAKICRISLASP